MKMLVLGHKSYHMHMCEGKCPTRQNCSFLSHLHVDIYVWGVESIDPFHVIVTFWILNVERCF